MRVGANSYLFYRAKTGNARKRPIKVHLRNFEASDVPPGTNGTGYRRLRLSIAFQISALAESEFHLLKSLRTPSFGLALRLSRRCREVPGRIRCAGPS